jgi:ubiquinone/menaquinone biosynthesis C-methylase UbiE
VSNVTPASQPDLNAVKERQRQMWASGDYNEIGSRLLIISELLYETLDPQPGDRALDVASGSGNAALAAARRFCDSTGTDYVPELIERGRMRAKAEGLPVTFEVADAEQLPYPDASFDIVTSVIGAMFAPNQQRASQELLRVCRPGGTIGMANWTPDSFAGDLFRIVGSHVPPPPGVKPPAVWGTEDGLHDLLGSGVESLTIKRRHYSLRYRSMEHFIDFHRTYFGPVRTAFEHLDAAGQEQLAHDLSTRAAERNRSDNEIVIVDSEYLEVVAVRA